MGFMDEKLWGIFEEKVREEDADVQRRRQIGYEYISAVRRICQYGVDRAETIRDTFPMFTLHNETHICNVMQLMSDLLGDDIDLLTRDEAAMLIMSACCHDIGMSYSDEEKEALFSDGDRLNQYLESNHSEYVKAYSGGCAVPNMTDDMIQNFLRSIHHERVMDLLCGIEWPGVLGGRVDREDLIRICQSHGKDIASLDDMEPTATIDLRFCAILLRVADLLDFDTSRVPEGVYRYSGFDKANDANTLKSKEEWDKHLASQGFDFAHVGQRTHLYSLDYSATCKSMQVEQAVNCYLDWVDQELNHCGKQIKRFAGKWQNFILPGKIRRNIKSEGYVSGQFCLSLDQDKILELFVGENLYSDPAVFVRELIQNAIDAVRTREQLDQNLPSGWKGQINIRCWMDQEGYHWFRIEDNGIGMTEDIIKNYFLKVGNSYYTSDTFEKSKLQCNADPDYMPISRFGIGILSCFMGDEETNRVEVSTKHFREGDTYYPALRLSMHGINGYFYLSNKDKKHMPEPMKGVTQKEQAQYLNQPGTAIAVRTNLYQTGKYRGFKEIVDRYVIYPPVAIHYDGEEGSCDYLTEKEFTDGINAINPSDDLREKGLMEFVIPDEDLEKIHREVPEIYFEESPRLLLKCISLENYTCTPYLKGAVLTAKVEGGHKPIYLKLGNRYVGAKVCVELNKDVRMKMFTITIHIDFDLDFRKQMDLIQENRKKFLIKKCSFQYPNDKIKRDILISILDNTIDNIYWKKCFKRKYGISEKKSNDEIKLMTEFIKKNNSSKISEDDFATMQAYNALQKEWRFDICSLLEFDWYQKYFKNKLDKAGGYSIVSHNGILCGDAYFFDGFKTIPAYPESTLGTIILFKDKYRPDLDVVRDGVRRLNLKMACEVEIIKKNIIKQGFGIKGEMSSLLEEQGYSYIVMDDYCKLLNEREDLAKQLVFKTNKGFLSNEDLSDKLIKQEKIVYMSCPPVSDSEGMWKKEYLYEYLCVAYLRENYSLQVDLNVPGMFISNKKREISNNYKKLFPACFFLPELHHNSSILTAKETFNRYACNEYHRLSQFIIKYGTELKKYVPGIFRELLRTLAEKDEEELINRVNVLLEDLKKYPGALFEIPDELFLSEKDLL